MNDKIEKEVIKLPPFKRMCMTIGELPTSYLESMTYYEMLIWFTNYLSKTVIPTINNNAQAITEIQELFTKLQDYVNNYFDNLDVQEEINNKLDQMVEDGTFEEIISTYYQNCIEKTTFRSKLYMNKIGRINHTNEINSGYVGCQAGIYINDNIYQLYVEAFIIIDEYALITSSSYNLQKGMYLYLYE